MSMDLEQLVKGLNPSGLDPELEKKADEYGRRTWQMDMAPVLEKVLGDVLTEDLVVELQQALFEHKYTVLLNSETKLKSRQSSGRRW